MPLFSIYNRNSRKTRKESGNSAEMSQQFCQNRKSFLLPKENFFCLSDSGKHGVIKLKKLVAAVTARVMQ
jgi:hypothetical protein